MDTRETWDDLVGDAWVRHADEIDAHSAPFGAALLEALTPVPGRRILDVGCGVGSTTISLARRGADVVGIDLSTRMIDHARTRDLGEPMGNATFEVADATSYSPDEPFDEVCSRFGVMFFADPPAAFAHLRSLVRPEGRLAFAAWSDPSANLWMLEPVMASVPVLGPPALPGPTEPGPFSLSSPERVHEVLGAAGWQDVDIEEVAVEGPHPAGGARAVAEMVVETVPLLAEGLAAKPEARDELCDAIADALRPREHGGRVTVQASALIVTAHA